jgi:hypothetical protein
MSEVSSMPLADSDSMDTQKHSGKPEEIRWEEVATTIGIIPAQIIVGRLRSEGIPARAWQQSAGQAIGLTVGPMGTAHVVVPEEFLDIALEILENVDELPYEEEDWGIDEESEIED